VGEGRVINKIRKYTRVRLERREKVGKVDEVEMKVRAHLGVMLIAM
jgi:hypothetical protein